MTQRDINIWLVRHAVSAANLDKAVNAALPDAEVPLGPDGPAQAAVAGNLLGHLLGNGVPESPTVRALTGMRSLRGRTRVLCSPYLRTRQTAKGVCDGLDRAGVQYDYREEIALREISFGLFDGYTDEELPQAFPLEHAHYQKHMQNPASEFWAAMPMGESRAQVADRVKGVFGTILRDNDPERRDPVRNFVVVSHGVTLRAFVMQWMHHPYEWYRAQKNPGNASVQLITGCSSSGPRYRHGFVDAGTTHTRLTPQDVREEGEVK